MWGPVSNALLHEVIAGQPTVTLCADYRSGTARDFSLLQRHGVITDTAGSNLVKFSRAGAHFAGVGRITHPDHALGRNTTGAVIIFGSMRNNVSGYSYLGWNGSYRRFYVTGANGVVRLGDGVSLPFLNINTADMLCLAFNYTSGVVSSVYKNGSYAGLLSAPITIIGDSAVPIIVGNSNAFNAPWSNPIACVFECNRNLSATEMGALYAEMAATRHCSKPWDKATLSDGRKVWASSFGVPVSTATRGGVTGQELENSGWRFGSTAFRGTVTADQQIDGKIHKTIKCVTAGPLSFDTKLMGMTPAQAAYGGYRFSISKTSALGGCDVYFINAAKTVYPTVGTQGYIISIRNDGSAFLYRINGVTVTALISKAAGYVANNVFYTFDVQRSGAGGFVVMIKGGSFANWTLFGSASDNTYTASNYVCVDSYAGDMVSLGSGVGDGLVHTSLAP